MDLKTFITTAEADVKAIAHIGFFKAAARQEVGNAMDKAYAALTSTTTEEVVVEDVNAFIETATASFGPEVAAFDKLAEIGIDKAIEAGFRALGNKVSADEIKTFVFAHLGLS
jgi:hypothetical protein